MAKFWYLATAMSYTKMVHKTNRKIVVSVFVVRKHDTEDESDDPKKNKTVHSYALGMDTIKLIIEKGGIDKLPTPPFTGGEWTKAKLQGLFYYLNEGSVLHTEWYVEDCPPDPNLYDPESYNCWKILSTLKSSTIDNIIDEWVYRFEDFLLYI